MGGALIIFSISVSTLLWGDLRNQYVWVVLLVMLAFGVVGWVDDYRKVVEKTHVVSLVAGNIFGKVCLVSPLRFICITPPVHPRKRR